MEFNLALKSSPSLIAITAKNRMQSAETCEMDFSGTDTQLTVYSKNKLDLENNIVVTEKFLTLLGDGRNSLINENAIVWDSIDFDIILKNFLSLYSVASTSRAFNEIALLTEWVNKATQSGVLRKWNVIVIGKKVKEISDNNWLLPNGKVIGKINRTIKTETDETMNIGVLSNKQDYIVDIMPENLSNQMKQQINNINALNKIYTDIRNEAGVGDVPLFIIYRIDKNSKANSRSKRKSLNMPTDLIGITMVIPGIRGKMTKRVHLKLSSNDSFNFGESEI